MKKSEFNNSIYEIKKAVENDKLVVFVGAGASKDSGVPLWTEAINEIKGYLKEEPIEEKDPLIIAQILYNEKGEKEYYDILDKVFFENIGSYNPIHEAIFDLNPEHIITTNYDYYFEDVIKLKGLPFSVVSKDIDLPYAKHKSLLIKYHGDFKNKNIVFKNDDYLSFSRNNTLKEIFVKSLFSNKVFLFVGYKLGDPNLKYLINEIQSILKRHHQRSYLLRHEKDISESEKLYFNGLGINIVEYPEDDTIFSKGKEMLSDTGNKVYKALGYISNFNTFKYDRARVVKENENSIIDDYYYSLKRFYYFRFLPENIISSLYPLSPNDERKTVIEFTTLVDYKGSFYNLLKSYEGENDEKFSKEEKRKINFILSRLIFSNIRYLGIKSGRKDSLGNQKTQNEISLYEKLFFKNKNSDCLQCNIEKYKYSVVIQEVKAYYIDENSKFEEDLKYAFVLNKIGEYFESYNAYKKIRNKANKSNKMDISFICSHNMQRIGENIMNKLILDNRYSYDDIESISKEAKLINLDKELERVKPFVDNDVYSFLKEVRDGWYIQFLCNQIDTIFNKVEESVGVIEKGGGSNNSFYSNLYNTIIKLSEYINRSYIVGNKYTYVNNYFQKAIEAFIYGIYISKLNLRPSQQYFGITKLEYFNSRLIDWTIIYADSKKTRKFLIEQKINNIKIDDSSNEYVVQRILNFLQSAINIRRYNKKDSAYLDYTNYNESFKKIVQNQFNNICIVLTYFEFDEDKLKEVYKSLNLFIKFFNFNFNYEFTYLKDLIKEKHKIIGVELLEDSINIMNDKSLQYESFYIELLKKIKELNPEYINENLKIEEISPMNYNKISNNIDVIYSVLSNKMRSSFMQEIERHIDNRVKSGSGTYEAYLLLKNNIPISKELLEQYKEVIHSFIENFSGWETYGKNRMYQIFQYIKLNILNLIEDEELKVLNIKSDKVRFLIELENFDKSKFQVEWLKLYYYKTLLEESFKIKFVQDSVEEELEKNFDSQLAEIYFKYKR